MLKREMVKVVEASPFVPGEASNTSTERGKRKLEAEQWLSGYIWGYIIG